MATLLADIGGTSSRWALLHDSAVPQLHAGLPGYNPAGGDASALLTALREGALGHVSCDRLYAYGAGCGSPERAQRLAAVLNERWPSAGIHVGTDLLGAARGLLQEGRGLVLILGTGMNAGWYDGERLHTPMPSLGFMLGDEGSGADIGRHALIDALHGRMPEELMDLLFPEGLQVADAVERVYRGGSPQAWLAAFTGKLAAMRNTYYVQELLAHRFGALSGILHNYFSDRRGVISATGSVAMGFAEELRTALEARGFNLSAVEQNPLEGLVLYHSRKR